MSKSKKAGFNLPGLPKSKRQDYPVIEAVVSKSKPNRSVLDECEHNECDHVCTLKSKHTPGPWELVIDNTGKVHQFIIRDAQRAPYVGFEIARINPNDIVRRDNNARLITAAPEMLEALRQVKRSLEILHQTDGASMFMDASDTFSAGDWLGHGTSKAIAMIDAAIAKAEGRDK